jgi:hypothetical protein
MCAHWSDNLDADMPSTVQWQRLTNTDTDSDANAALLYLGSPLHQHQPEPLWGTHTSPALQLEARPNTATSPGRPAQPPKIFPPASTSGPSAPAPTNKRVRWTTNCTQVDYNEDSKRGKGRQGQKCGARRSTARPRSQLLWEEKELISWFKHASVSNLFKKGSPIVLPSDVQKKWEQLIAEKSQDLQLPHDIQSRVRD